LEVVQGEDVKGMDMERLKGLVRDGEGEGESGWVSVGHRGIRLSKEEATVNSRSTVEPDNRDSSGVAVIKSTVLFAVGKAGNGPDKNST